MFNISSFMNSSPIPLSLESPLRSFLTFASTDAQSNTIEALLRVHVVSITSQSAKIFPNPLTELGILHCRVHVTDVTSLMLSEFPAASESSVAH